MLFSLKGIKPLRKTAELTFSDKGAEIRAGSVISVQRVSKIVNAYNVKIVSKHIVIPPRMKIYQAKLTG